MHHFPPTTNRVCSNVQGDRKHAEIDRDYEAFESARQVTRGFRGDAADERRNDKGRHHGRINGRYTRLGRSRRRRVRVGREARGLVVVVLGVAVAVTVERNSEGGSGESQNAHSVDRGHFDGVVW